MYTVDKVTRTNTTTQIPGYGIVFKYTFPDAEESRMTYLMQIIQALLYKETFLHTTHNNVPSFAI